MSELQNIWDDLERSKANKNRNGRWGFTIYRTDYEDQRLWRDYVRYLRSTIESTVDPDKDKPVADPSENAVEDRKTKDKRKFRRRIRANFELVVVQDRVLNGCTTAQVRQYHRQRIKTYLDGEALRSSALQNNGNDRPAEEGKDDHPAENATVKKETCIPPQLSLPTPAKEPEEEEDHEDDEENHEDDEENHAEENHDEENHAENNHEGEQSKPKRKRPPREEKRAGHVWQDYFLHANADVLKQYAHACHEEQQRKKHPSMFSYHHDEAPFVAIVAEAERSDYRLRRFGLWAGDGSVPELGMEWQYVEVTSLPGLYDRLGRRPLGRAQLLTETGAVMCGYHGGGAAGGGGSMGVCVPGGARRGVVVREPLYGRAFAAIGAEDHGPWYEGFCFPPAVNRM